jgi:hypothetical protein
MATKPSKKPRGKQVEWVGGWFESLAYVLEPEPFKPIVTLWMEGDKVLATEAAHPDERDAAFERSLRQALSAPMVGSPRRPTHVRVEDDEMAQIAERVLGDDVTVVLDETPEIYDVADAMDEATGPDADRGYLTDKKLAPAAVAAFFGAAAALYRAAPWGLIPDDSVVFGVDAPELGVRGGAAVVVGQSGVQRGVLLFDSFKAYRLFREASEGETGEELPGVAIFALDYEHDAAPALRAEVAAHGWPLPVADLFPVLRSIDAEAVERPLSTRDLRLAGSLAAAFAHLVDAEPDRLGASVGPTVTASAEGLTLTLPHPSALAERFEAAMAPRREVRVLVRRFLASELRGRVPGVWRDTADMVVDTLVRRRVMAKGPKGFERWPTRLVDDAMRDISHHIADMKELRRVVDVSDRFFAWMAQTGQMPAALAGELHAHIEEEAKVLEAAANDPTMRALAEHIAALSEGGEPNEAEVQKAVEAWARGVAEGSVEAPELFREQMGLSGEAPKKKAPKKKAAAPKKKAPKKKP